MLTQTPYSLDNKYTASGKGHAAAMARLDELGLGEAIRVSGTGELAERVRAYMIEPFVGA